MPQVQRIDPIALPSEKESVAAYCRVSTDSADQLNSYHSQIAYYTKLINDNPDWELYDLYADASITGTSIDKRDEFKRMLADCREGKIQRVLVKSVSRFARNTTELLETTRELKDLGVVVVFEEQGFDTSQVLGEMQLTMYAMAAQEESLSISKNMRWSYQKRMAAGRFVGTKPPFGFNLENGCLIQNEDAETVRDIYSLFLSGIGMQQIASILNNRDENGKHWGRTAITAILKNERYVGDALLQKRYTTDTLPFKEKYNNGAKQQYYIKDNHVGLISRDDFKRCQGLLLERGKNNQQASAHLFTHRIQCGNCQRYFRHINSSGKPYWVCPYVGKDAHSCRTEFIKEDILKIISINVTSKLYINRDEIINQIIAMLREIEYTQSGTDTKLFELNQSIAALNDKSLTLQKLSTKSFIGPEEYRIQSEALAAQRQRLTAQRNKKLHGLQSYSALEKLEELQAILSSWPGVPTEFDIDQFDEIVEKIIPTADNKLTFRLHCGLELTEEIPS